MVNMFYFWDPLNQQVQDLKLGRYGRQKRRNMYVKALPCVNLIGGI